MSDLVVHNRRDHRGALAETTAKPADDIVLAAAFPDLECAGGSDPAVTGVEPQHDFTECCRVPSALLTRFDIERHRYFPPRIRRIRSSVFRTLTVMPG